MPHSLNPSPARFPVAAATQYTHIHTPDIAHNTHSQPSPAGRRKSVCPYYAARRVLPKADVVLAPYSSLLVESTREALGLRVERSVVIVDEGHNLGERGVTNGFGGGD